MDALLQCTLGGLCQHIYASTNTYPGKGPLMLVLMKLHEIYMVFYSKNEINFHRVKYRLYGVKS